MKGFFRPRQRDWGAVLQIWRQPGAGGEDGGGQRDSRAVTAAIFVVGPA